MKLAKIKNRIKSVVIASALSLALLAGFPAVEAHAATGSVYTCTINRCYAHPVTGAVEDSGGAGSYATGQGMVEGCVYPTGILEVADDGNYYLTIRLSLMDYTSGHDFQVQSVGDSGWSSTFFRFLCRPDTQAVMAELADALVLGASGQPCGFESH